MIKPRGVDLGKKIKKSLWGIFISIICRHKIENRNYRKNAKKRHWFLNKMASPALGGIPNVSNSRCYQKLSDTIYRTEIGYLQDKTRKIKFNNWLEFCLLLLYYILSKIILTWSDEDFFQMGNLIN